MPCQLPDTGPVHVPQKQVADVRRLAKHGGERVCVVQLDSIQARDSDIERRMVHEQVNRIRIRFL